LNSFSNPSDSTELPLSHRKIVPTSDSSRSRFAFFLKASRPGFWLTSIWFYLLPISQKWVFGSTAFWLGLIFVTFPLGILIYGWNDIADAETDRYNPRKGTYLFGARGTDEELRMLPRIIIGTHLPFLLLFWFLAGPRMLLWYAALVLATALYNQPRFGFKSLPFLDMVNQLGYLLVFYLSSALNHVPQLPLATFVFGALFAMHSHLLGQIMDIVPDRQAGRRTTAQFIGVIPAKYLLVAFLAGESLLVLFSFRDRVVAALLGCGAIWFLIDVMAIFRSRPYPDRLMRFFLIGWNIAALASIWWIWSVGSLSR